MIFFSFPPQEAPSSDANTIKNPKKKRKGGRTDTSKNQGRSQQSPGGLSPWYLLIRIDSWWPLLRQLREKEICQKERSEVWPGQPRLEICAETTALCCFCLLIGEVFWQSSSNFYTSSAELIQIPSSFNPKKFELNAK